MADYEIFKLGDVVLQCKQTLRDAKLAYKTLWDAECREGQRDCLPYLVFWAAL